MANIINAQAGVGLTQTADGSGIVKLQSNGVTTNALAWVTFNGSTATIMASYNVSSITRTATGTYTIALAVSLSDANYSVVATSGNKLSGGTAYGVVTVNDNALTPSASGFGILVTNASTGITWDLLRVGLVIFGN